MPLARELAPYFQVWIPDLPGFGKSARTPRALDVAQLAQALAAWIEVVGHRRPIVIGQSFGCQVVTALAATAPELVERVVLSGPTLDPRLRDPALGLLPWLRKSPPQGELVPARMRVYSDESEHPVRSFRTPSGRRPTLIAAAPTDR